jgi:hypothetical protein
MNMEPGSEYNRAKLAQIIANHYNNYEYERADAATRRAKGMERVTFEKFEENFFRPIYENEAVFMEFLKPEFKKDAGFLQYLKALYHSKA